jgi:hypothetical protein
MEAASLQSTDPAADDRPARPAPAPRGRVAAGALALAVLVLVGGWASAPRRVRLEVGAFHGSLLDAGWSRSSRADVDPQAAPDGRTSFYYRAAPLNTVLTLPFRPPGGPLTFTLRGTARVRGALGVFVSGERVGELLVRPGAWDRYSVELAGGGRGGEALVLSLALRPLPLVRGAHVSTPEVLVDYLELESARGLAPSWPAGLLAATVPLAALAFALLVGGTAVAALGAGLAGAAGALALLHVAPLPFLLAVPRLLPLALAAGLLTRLLLRRALPRQSAGLAVLVALGALLHGAVVFFPDHNPPDIDIHVRRTLDLAGVPLDYHALLRYGSQLPTASQDQGAATAALGERTLIPYSPLPYLAYYALHAAGLDLYWAMTAVNAALAMALVPWLWLVAAEVWDRRSAWLAALLYTLDLAVWHHVGRSHAPAAFGGVLATAALLLLAREAGRLDRPRRVAAAALALGTAALGYSSAPVLLGLFGLVLLVLLALDAGGVPRASRRGLLAALALGGLLAGALFYFHYVPGLLAGARGVEAEPDLFPGKSFAVPGLGALGIVFHNESRQSLRLWVLGFWIALLAGLVAAPLALRRARRDARPVLVAWFGSWTLVMALKEPAFFPRLLRWAKEDQFLSPLLCLLVAAAASGVARPWLRRALWAAVLLAAAWLQCRDFAHHAESLRL